MTLWGSAPFAPRVSEFEHGGGRLASAGIVSLGCSLGYRGQFEVNAGVAFLSEFQIVCATVELHCYHTL